MSDLNLKPEDLDRLGQAVLTLTKELWVMKDRVKVLEVALSEAGVIASDAVDTFQPDTALTAALSQERAQLIKNVLAALEAKPE